MPRLKRPADWPPNMIAKGLSNGLAAYYWQVPSKDKLAGCTLTPEALGRDYGPARNRAIELNQLLYAWRKGEETETSRPALGTIDWLVEEYTADKWDESFDTPITTLRERYPASSRFRKLKRGTRKGYIWGLELISERVRPRSKSRWGHVRLADLKPHHADQLYETLADPEGAERWTSAAGAIRSARAAWNHVHRYYPHIVPKENPFEGVDLKSSGRKVEVATWEDLQDFMASANNDGLHSLALAAIVSWEFLQRAEHIRTAAMWSDVEPERIKVEHPKRAGTVVYLQRHDPQSGAPIYPEFEAQLSITLRRGPNLVMRDRLDRRTRTFLPYEKDWFEKESRRIMDLAGLAKTLSFRSFRKGGFTEGGDAGASDQEMQAAGGHRTRAMLSVYTKRTNEQALTFQLKRRALRERRANIKT